MNEALKRVNILVEGQTEETFVKLCLANYAATKDVYLIPRLLQIGPTSARKHKGGVLTYEKVRRDVCRWLKEDTSAMLTTMIDLYALPDDFPKFSDAQKIKDPYERVQLLEKAFTEDVGATQFFPYIQLHEFEALLYTDVSIIDKAAGLYDPSQMKELQRIIDEFKNPELINDSPITAPSKRLRKLFPQYDKVTMGVLIAESIGIDQMGKTCKHFSDWISRFS